MPHCLVLMALVLKVAIMTANNDTGDVVTTTKMIIVIRVLTVSV